MGVGRRLIRHRLRQFPHNLTTRKIKACSGAGFALTTTCLLGNLSLDVQRNTSTMLPYSIGEHERIYLVKRNADTISETTPSKLQAWILASRPKTLPAAAIPVIVGTALAVDAGTFRFWPALAALCGALLIQIGTNFHNDLYDFKRGTDTEERLGPTRVTSAGLLSPRDVEVGTWVTFGVAALIGLYLIYVGGWPILVIGVASILAAVGYTAGPVPYGYYGLGDLFVFVFFGLVAVIGTYYVQALAVPPAAVLASIPVGALSTAILVVNNVRDLPTDRAAGKRTLAVILGRAGAGAEYALLLFSAYVVPLLFWALLNAGVWILLPWLTAPLAVRLYVIVRTETSGDVLNKALAQTAQLLALYGILFSVGLVM